MAEKDKIFYWLKLRKEFMNGETIDFLMSQKNGANYVVLYQMLIMQTLNTKGELCNKIGECIIPFNVEKIQRDCKWFDIDTVRVAMELYAKLGLIYKNENNIFTIANFEEMVGSETYWAKIKRIEREQKDVGQIPMNVQNPLISNISNLDSNNLVNNNIHLQDNIKEKDLEKERLVDEYGFSAKVKDSISLWLQHKKEKRQTYQPTGLKQLLTKLKSLANEHGDDYVVEIINSSITNNYSGIFAKNKRVQNNAAYHHNESYTENYDEENRRNQLIDGCPF